MNFKEALKERFGSLQQGLGDLEEYAGPNISYKALAEFLNFHRIPFSTHEAENTVKALGNRKTNKSQFVVSSASIRASMQTPAPAELDSDLRQQLTESQLRQAFRRSRQSLDEFIARLQPSLSTSITAKKVADELQLAVEDVRLCFKRRFGKTSISQADMVSLLSTPARKSAKASYRGIQALDAPSALVLEFASKLQSEFAEVKTAYAAICTVKTSAINFFKVQRCLKDFGMTSNKEAVKELILALGHGTTYLSYYKFKQFWTNKANVCQRHDCVNNAITNKGYCRAHANLLQTKAQNLYLKLEQSTRAWKSPRQKKQFFSDLSSSQLQTMRENISRVAPATFLTDREARDFKEFLKSVEVDVAPQFTPLASVRVGNRSNFAPRAGGFEKVRRLHSARATCRSGSSATLR